MKPTVVLLCVVFGIQTLFAQTPLWRPGEMEAKVYLSTAQDVITLKSLKLMDEPASYGEVMASWVYITPEERVKLDASGLRYEITMADLNEYSTGFWDRMPAESYHNYTQLVALSDSLATHFPAICSKIMLGTSLQGRELAVLKISDNVTADENEAELLFDGAIHGNEIMGPEILIRYARDLCLGYGTNPLYTELINTREIFLYYLVNPDGFVGNSRYNANGVDLNRDIGFMWRGEGNSLGPFSQHESKILRSLWLDNSFVLYQNYHGGTEEISLPWSYSGHQSDDWAHINNLAGIYSSSSGYSSFPYGQGWYSMYQIMGSTKDFHYGVLGQVSWSNEITSLKQPPASQIPMYYSYNVPAMTEMIKRVGWGVEGLITDSVTGSPVRAAVFVGNYYPVFTDPAVGDYHKFVLPGTYSITVKASGYATKTITGITVAAESSAVTNIQLAPAEGRYACRAIITEIPYYPQSPVVYADECYIPGMIGPPDSLSYSIGRSGSIVVDMGDTIFNGTGNDFKVFEGDTSPESYNVHVSNFPDGPWTSMGTGTGTTGFDLSYGSVTSCRYIKVTDDGNGQTNINDAGFDLDAIQILTPPLIADFTASNNTPCQGTSLQFTDQSTGNPTNWLWSFPGATPSSSTQQNPANILYNTPGVYDVSLTIVNAYTQTSLTKTSFIHVIGIPEAPSVPTGPTSVCQNGSSTYTTTGSASATSFNWILYPTEAGTVLGVWMTVSVDWNDDFSGEVFLKVSEVNACGEGPYSDSLAITVKIAPTVTLGSDTLICPQDLLILDAGNPGCVYEWSTGATTQTIPVDSATYGIGIHPFWVSVFNTVGCMAIDTITVTIDICSGMDEPARPGILRAYPNPSEGTFTVSASGFSGGFLEILDPQGQLVIPRQLIPDATFSEQFDLTTFAKGVYLIRIVTNQQSVHHKIIIQ